MKRGSKSPEYQPYVPGTLDEDGNGLHEASWEKQRDRAVRLEIRRNGKARGRVALVGHQGISKRQVYAIRRHFDPEFRRKERIKERLVIGGIALVIGGIAVGGIAGAVIESNSPPSESLKPNERFTFDYLTVGVGGSECLEDTAYDLTAGSQGRSSVTPPSASYNRKTDILTITPNGGDPLRLEGFDQTEHTLSPVGESDQDIFDSYGCEVENY